MCSTPPPAQATKPQQQATPPRGPSPFEAVIPWASDELGAERMRLYQRSRQQCAQYSAAATNIYTDSRATGDGTTPGPEGSVYEAAGSRWVARCAWSVAR